MQENSQKRVLLDTILNYSEKKRREFVKRVQDKNESQITIGDSTTPNTISLSGLDLDEKVRKLVEEIPGAHRYLDELEVAKGYKYAFLYKYNHIDAENIKKVTKNLENLTEQELLDFSQNGIYQTVYKETPDFLYLKFHYEFTEYRRTDSGSLEPYSVRHANLLVVHKDLQMVDVRFDRLTTRKDDNFFARRIETQLAWIKANGSCDLMPLELSDAIADIVENHKDNVFEEACSVEFAEERGALFKFGKNPVMPVLGELEDLLDEHEDGLNVNLEPVIKLKEALEEFIFQRKELSSKLYHELKWLKQLKGDIGNDVRVKVTFNYRDASRDLLQFTEGKFNSLETMNYVVRYIKSIERDSSEQ